MLLDNYALQSVKLHLLLYQRYRHLLMAKFICENINLGMGVIPNDILLKIRYDFKSADQSS